jgi:multidrug efflux pump subunit AcrA (membrane-fusion protein)
MKKEDLIKLGLDEEMAQKVADTFAEYLKGFIPKSRFDEVNEAKKKLEQDIKTRDEQLEVLKKIDAEGLQAEIEKLQKENKATKAKFEADLKKMKVDNAVEKALLEAKAKNTVAAKALLKIDYDKAELDEDGKVKGLDDEIKRLVEAEETKFLFDVQSKNDKPGFKGIKPGERKDGTPGDGKPTSLADAVRMHFQSNE